MKFIISFSPSFQDKDDIGCSKQAGCQFNTLTRSEYYTSQQCNEKKNKGRRKARMTDTLKAQGMDSL